MFLYESSQIYLAVVFLQKNLTELYLCMHTMKIQAKYILLNILYSWEKRFASRIWLLDVLEEKINCAVVLLKYFFILSLHNQQPDKFLPLQTGLTHGQAEMNRESQPQRTGLPQPRLDCTHLVVCCWTSWWDENWYWILRAQGDW